MSGRIPKIVVVGPSFVDMAVRCSKMPSPGEVAEAQSFSHFTTGFGPNCAAASALCDCEVSLLSKIGKDLFGRMVLDYVLAHGVNTEFVYTIKAVHTGVILTMVDSSGENSSCISFGANRFIGADELACAEAEQLISSADVCLISGALSNEAVKAAIQTASLGGTKTILCMEMPVAEEIDFDALNWPIEFFTVTALLPSFREGSSVVDPGRISTHRLKHIGSEIVARGVECAVIRRGSKGCIVIERNGAASIPALQLSSPLAEHSYCTDVFAGALAASCGVGDEPIEAVRFAYAAWAAAGQKYGSANPIPTKPEILEVLLRQPD